MASWILFGASCVVALFTLNAYFPIRRNKVLFLPSFFASWLTIELVWWHLIWEAAGVVALVWLGALDRPIGWAGLAIFLVNWLALTFIFLGGRRAAPAAAVALESIAGDDIEVERHSGVKRTKNITYRRAGGKELRLDVYEPSHPAEPGVKRPAVLQIHGGAWIIGDKREQGIPLLKLLASHGWVGFNANYRLSPSATWPDHLVDLKYAVAWIREHADEYGVDPDFIAVTGGSAGGHLTAMVALTANDARFQPGFEGADTTVQAAVPFYGVYDFTNRNGTMPDEFVGRFLEPFVMKAFLSDDPELFASASPLDNVHADAPPFFVIHGDNDTLAPVEDARTFTKALGDVSDAPVFYLELKGAQHAFDVFSSVRTRRVIRATHRFLAVMHTRYKRGVSDEVAPPESEMVEGTVRVDEPADVERATAS
jgi:acetyl esterase/lipase